MSEIVTKSKQGDTVWWVNWKGRVIKGTVLAIQLCEESGALYCNIYSPSHRINQYPVVHYSEVFLSRGKAEEFAEYQKENPDNVFPRCMGCHYNAMKAAIMKEDDNGNIRDYH